MDSYRRRRVVFGPRARRLRRPARRSRRPRQVRVILIGAAARTEERVLLETNYWAEVGHLLPDIDGVLLCFVGPEVSPSPPAQN